MPKRNRKVGFPVFAGRTLKGTVVKWIERLGYGFAKPDGQAHDVYLEATSVVEGKIFEGARIEFDCLQSKTVCTRYHARRVKVIGEIRHSIDTPLRFLTPWRGAAAILLTKGRVP